MDFETVKDRSSDSDASEANREIAAKDEEVFREALGRNPNDPASHYGLASRLFEQGDGEQALHFALIATSLDPLSPKYRLFAVELLFRLRDPEHARGYSQKLHSDHPTSPEIVRQCDSVAARALLKHGAVDLVQEDLAGALDPRLKHITTSADNFGKRSVLVNLSGDGFKIELSAGFAFETEAVERFSLLAPLLSEMEHNGKFKLCLGDFAEGDDDQVCFAGRSEAHFIAPDPAIFAMLAEAAPQPADPLLFEQKEPILFWRGALSGPLEPDHIGQLFSWLPVRACLAARYWPQADMRIVDWPFFKVFDPVLKESLEGLDVLAVETDPAPLSSYKYLVDLGGVESVGARSLVGKLRAAGGVVQVETEQTSWLYRRLTPGKHVLRIAAYNALSDAYDHLESDPELAYRIASAGQESVLSLTQQDVDAAFRDVVHSAIRRS